MLITNWLWDIQCIALIVVFATVWSLVPRAEWWVRGFDFPRLQIMTVGLVDLALLIVWQEEWTKSRVVILLLLMGALAYQLKMILPYTILWRKQVKEPKVADPTQQIRMLVSNVLMTNNKYELLLAQIREHQPDVVLTLETNGEWELKLSSLKQDYPHVVSVPLENLYGMHLFSRLELQHTKVKFLLSEEIPSIHTTAILKSGKRVRLFCLHPKPPSPTEAYKSTLRDAELLSVGRYIDQHKHTSIVMGDLNDVAWSRTTRLFQRISGLLDPRIGRYFVNTFHADYPLCRWSLDHVFHSPDFTLVCMERLPHIGSDHFPVLTTLQYTPQAEEEQPALEATSEDFEEAEEKIQEGIKEAEKVVDDDVLINHRCPLTLL